MDRDDDRPGVWPFIFDFPWLRRPAKNHDDRTELKLEGKESMTWREIDDEFHRAALLEAEHGWTPTVTPITARAFAKLTVYLSRPIIRAYNYVKGRKD